MVKSTDLSEENRVIVRYWPGSLSSFSANSTGSWVSFGHVALQTFVGGRNNRGHYISFWRADVDHRCCGKQESHIHDREEDTIYCGQAHIDNTYTLYTLDAKAINAAYEKMIRRGIKWELSASFFHRQNENAATCSSLIYRLLVAGGLNRLMKNNDRVLLGLPSTARTTLLLSTLITGSASSMLKKIILKASYITVEIKCWSLPRGRVMLVYHFFNWGLSPFIKKDCFKNLLDNTPDLHSVSTTYTSPFDVLRNLVHTLEERAGFFWCNTILTATLSLACVALFIIQRAATNYLIVKPADFP